MNQRSRRVAGLLLGIGVAMLALAMTGARLAGQRVLYIVAGALFVIGAVILLRRPNPS
jgi:hypothetical protein